MTPDWASLFFILWPLCSAEVSVWSQTLVSLSRGSSSLQLAVTARRVHQGGLFWPRGRHTQSYHAVSASLGKRGTNHCSEYTLPLLLLFSLCVLRVTMVPAQITTTSSRFDSESGRDVLIPSSLISAHPLGTPSLWGASTPSCARKFPLALRSTLQFSFTLGWHSQGLCVSVLYVLYVKKVIGIILSFQTKRLCN